MRCGNLREEDGGVLDGFVALTHVGPNLVSQIQNGRHN